MLENCQPRELFSIFEDFCAIPHPSRATAAATDFCRRFATQAGLACTVDGAGNVIIRKPAASGYESAPTVILQGHLDMVAAREADSPRDPEREGLSLFVDGDLIGAHGTTLGGDDGIAVAMILAILADRTAAHPALEAVFTTDEEIGMLGAEALDMSALRGRYLLNLDSEEEGVLTVSCAGGATLHISRPVCSENRQGAAITLAISGGRGGHSGAEIHRGRANALHLGARLLAAACAVTDCRLVSFVGGEKDNAIPPSATLTFFAADTAAATAALREEIARAAAAYREADPALAFSLDEHQFSSPAVSAEDTRVLSNLFSSLPCGMQEMSREIEGLVETSLNLGILRWSASGCAATYSVRSSVQSKRDALLTRLRTAAEAAGATVSVEGAYPAWEYKKNSPLRDTVLAVYRRLHGRDMRVEAIHAGLECGLFSDRIPGLECVSLGPDMRDIHTTRERLSISSSARTYRFVREILAAIH